ncbi:MAG: S24/S26 family peptidase [Clostridia bacterium]|nr:S24/S26 family peptidase [Clostridia bacterium]
MHKVVELSSARIFPLINELLDSGSSVRITVTGTSMYPFLRNSVDSVELSHTDFKNLHRGDIILVHTDNKEYILHRVVRKEKDYLYICGDAQKHMDGPIYPRNIRALVTAVWREGKRIKHDNFLWKLLSSTWLYLLPFRAFIINAYWKLKGFK